MAVRVVARAEAEVGVGVEVAAVAVAVVAAAVVAVAVAVEMTIEETQSVERVAGSIVTATTITTDITTAALQNMGKHNKYEKCIYKVFDEHLTK